MIARRRSISTTKRLGRARAWFPPRVIDGICLSVVKSRDAALRSAMANHYSLPGGFVGRSIVYRVSVGGISYGYTTAGSATRYLVGRAAFLCEDDCPLLDRLINNTFFHIERVDGKYPMRNFIQRVILMWEKIAVTDWRRKYGDDPVAFETLVEPPRTGECYLRAGWTLLPEMTKGYTCRRTAGRGSDSWTGKRVWNTTDLRPKHVLMKMVSGVVA